MAGKGGAPTGVSTLPETGCFIKQLNTAITVSPILPTTNTAITVSPYTTMNPAMTVITSFPAMTVSFPAMTVLPQDEHKKH